MTVLAFFYLDMLCSFSYDIQYYDNDRSPRFRRWRGIFTWDGRNFLGSYFHFGRFTSGKDAKTTLKALFFLEQLENPPDPSTKSSICRTFLIADKSWDEIESETKLECDSVNSNIYSCQGHVFVRYKLFAGDNSVATSFKGFYLLWTSLWLVSRADFLLLNYYQITLTCNVVDGDGEASCVARQVIPVFLLLLFLCMYVCM